MKKQMRQATRSWYFEASVKPTFQPGQYDDIGFGHYADDGGGFGEAKLVFYRWGAQGGIAMSLDIFTDAFAALAEDLAAIMRNYSGEAGNDGPTPEAVLTWMAENLGYEDATEEVGPYRKASVR